MNCRDEIDYGAMTKREFKRAELEFELRDEEEEIRRERNTYVNVHINDKFWKNMPLPQARACARTLIAKGKKVVLI